ncbi:MAG: hypothetical protein ABH808_00635 [Candidatus Kuenenbacteria bacterium]
MFKKSLKNLTFRCFVYFDGKYYTAVCLDLGIIEQRKEGLEKAVNMLNKAIEGYLMVAEKHNYPLELLYRPAENKYWRKYKNFLVENLEATKIEFSPLSIFQIYTRSYSLIFKKEHFIYAQKISASKI